MTTETIVPANRLEAAEAHGGNGCQDSRRAGRRLHLGAGNVHIAGWDNLDRKTGQEIFPLDYPDNSAEEILCSHTLEHFPHGQVNAVLHEWYRVLKPGGKMRLAVPDFEFVAREYLAGEPVNVQGFVMGGHADENDYHKCIFDRESLTEQMAAVGLERIGPWKSDIPGCSQLPCSLNLQGFKPISQHTTLENVRACMSVPRFGPMMHPRCVERALFQLHIKVNAASSCFWHQKLSDLMEECIADPACQYVLTMDYDTIFSAADVLELYRLLQVFPEADAIVPLQSKRGCEDALFSLVGPTGQVLRSMHVADLDRLLLPMNTGHFGLTIFRADSLRRFERPWMVPKPGPTGRWDDQQTDADIDFWQHFRRCGFHPFLAPRVVVGHLEEVVTWPGKELKPVHQQTADYDKNGIPAEVLR